MRLLSSRWAIWLVFLTTSTTLALAQPETRDHRRRPPPPTADVGPTEAPPPLKVEAPAAKAGFVWITGRWDWRVNKWEWVAGHWERERAGKRWRDGRWDRRDNRWVYVDGEWIDANAAPPPSTTTPAPPPTTTPPPTTPPVAGPSEAPPPPREEKFDRRAGFVWIPGQWDWRDGKWDWVAGHWERERAGKRWRASRWEQREGRWARVEGDWIDQNAPDAPPPMEQPGRRRWRLERPVVSSYWPIKGKAGSRVIIRGKNFPASASVTFAGQPVMGAKITPEQIVFVVPAGAASGPISVRAGGRRELLVGQFEVAAGYDPIAEQKRIDEERRKAAEAAWAARQQQLAKDRAAREAALQQMLAERAASRERRRQERIAALQARWQRAFLADEDTQDELTLHAQRVAELTRAREVAELSANGKLVIRIDVLQSREDQRHQDRMAALEASFKVRGGTP
jgi:hypothetical protein